MKCYSLILALSLGGWLSQTFGADYVTLSADNTQRSSRLITLASNEVATVIHLSTTPCLSGPGGCSSAYLEVASGGVTNNYMTELLIGGAQAGQATFVKAAHANLPLIAGPATLRMVVTGFGYAGLCTMQITRPSDHFVPSNSVVVPDDTNGPVTIILESSTDLLNWAAANPGTYGTTTTKRFFRVRAQR